MKKTIYKRLALVMMAVSVFASASVSADDVGANCQTFLGKV